MSRRHLIAAGIALGLSLSVVPVPVSSAPPPVYPPGVSTISVVADKQAYATGETAFVSALACHGGATVTFTFSLSSGRVFTINGAAETADDTTVATVTVPIDELADYQVLAECNGKNATTSFVTFQLPVTGSDIHRPIVVALLVLFTGVGLLLVARTRRRTIAV